MRLYRPSAENPREAGNKKLFSERGKLPEEEAFGSGKPSNGKRTREVLCRVERREITCSSSKRRGRYHQGRKETCSGGKKTQKLWLPGGILDAEETAKNEPNGIKKRDVRSWTRGNTHEKNRKGGLVTKGRRLDGYVLRGEGVKRGKGVNPQGHALVKSQRRERRGK